MRQTGEGVLTKYHPRWSSVHGGRRIHGVPIAPLSNSSQKPTRDSDSPLAQVPRRRPKTPNALRTPSDLGTLRTAAAAHSYPLVPRSAHTTMAGGCAAWVLFIPWRNPDAGGAGGGNPDFIGVVAHPRVAHGGDAPALSAVRWSRRVRLRKMTRRARQSVPQGGTRARERDAGRAGPQTRLTAQKWWGGGGSTGRDGPRGGKVRWARSRESSPSEFSFFFYFPFLFLFPIFFRFANFQMQSWVGFSNSN
jgi:hypothetical protein